MSEEKIMRYVAGDAVDVWNKAKGPLDNFLKETSKKPKPGTAKKNEYANNAEYYEIGYVQAALDRIYHGLYNWKITFVQQMINGVLIIGDLSVFHPIANVWITRSGSAFKEFQLRKGATEPSHANLSKKAIERDIGIADSEAMKNAAKKLGNAFGRHLNRKFQFEHIPDEGIVDRLFNEKKGGDDETT